MAKAGTGWFTDQLRDHPDVWTPPVGEMSYLGQGTPSLRQSEKQLNRFSADHRKTQKRRERHGIGDREIAFLEEIAALAGQPRDLEKYVALYRHKGNQKSVDTSPGYTLLDPDMIGQIARRLPDVRVVVLVRDPVARLWSHISMLMRSATMDEDLLTKPEAFRNYLETEKVAGDRSRPTRVVAHWRNAAPELAFRHFFFDDISERPEQARRDVLEFLGLDPEKGGGIPAGYNRKAVRTKYELSKELEAVIVEHYRDELRACADTLGGPAKQWAARYGV